MSRATYQPLLPVIAAWSLEFIEATAVVFVQRDGTDINVIGSRLWKFTALNNAIAELKEFPWRKRIETHITPPDTDGLYAEAFEKAGLDCEDCPRVSEVQTVFLARELFPVLHIDNEARPWVANDNNNAELIESINGYRVERTRQSETFASKPAHSWERYLVRALEVFALWNNANGAPGWGQKPDASAYNRGVI